MPLHSLATFRLIKCQVMLRKSVYGLLIILSLASCEKERTTDHRSSIYVKYTDADNYLLIEDIIANWQPAEGTVSVMAEGIDHEMLKLYLHSVKQPGAIGNLSIKNIHFTDGLDFDATRFVDGSIHISSLNTEAISGEFHVSLEDDLYGRETRSLEGSFRIVPR